MHGISNKEEMCWATINIGETMVTEEELLKCFSLEYPEDMDYLSRSTPEEEPHDSEARDETIKYKGIRWVDVSTELLEECYDIPLLFNPRAFHYFFPAFIKQTQDAPERNELLIDCLIGLLAEETIPDVESIQQTKKLLQKFEPEFKNEIDEITDSLLAIDKESLVKWIEERFKLFNLLQWCLIKKWMQFVVLCESLCMDKERIEAAEKNIDRWILRKKMDNEK
jgi:hypothetical protein